MRTSLNEIKFIDDHIFNNGAREDGLLFDAMLIINPELSNQIIWQRKAHTIVQRYSRKKLRAEVEAAHSKLFNEPEHQSFRQRLWCLFSKQ